MIAPGRAHRRQAAAHADAADFGSDRLRPIRHGRASATRASYADVQQRHAAGRSTRSSTTARCRRLATPSHVDPATRSCRHSRDDQPLEGGVERADTRAGERHRSPGGSADAARSTAPRDRWCVTLRACGPRPCRPAATPIVARRGLDAAAAMPPLITREEALRLGELEDRAEIEALIERAWQVARRALRGRDRPVLARQREVRRLRAGLRLLRPVALRRGRDAAARDDGARADPRARARGRGRGRAPLLHGHAGPGPLQARLREGARGHAARRRAHEPQALRVDRAHVAPRARRR